VVEPFETPETAARSIWYGCTGIPDVRIDGKYGSLGAASCAVAYTQYRDLFLQRRAETNGLSPIEIAGEYDCAGGRISMTATFRLVDPVVLSELR
jgi:hypothetical protein